LLQQLFDQTFDPIARIAEGSLLDPSSESVATITLVFMVELRASSLDSPMRRRVRRGRIRMGHQSMQQLDV